MKETEKRVTQPPETPTQEETGKRVKKHILTQRRKKILDLLRLKPRSVTELTNITGFCDPRSYIRYLRNCGFSVTDEWHKGADGSRYKVYSISK